MNVNLNNMTFDNVKNEISETKNQVYANLPKQTEEAGKELNAQLPMSKAEIQSNTIEIILNSAGFKPTDENKALVDMLLNDGKAVTKENLAALNRFVKLVGGENADKAMFFMNSDLKPTISNADNLVEVAEHNFQIGREAENLVENLAKSFDDTVLRNEITLKLADSLPKESILNSGEFEKAAAEIKNVIDNEISSMQGKESGQDIVNKNTADVSNKGVYINKEAGNNNGIGNNSSAANIKSGSGESNINEEIQTPIKKFVSENREQLLTLLKNSLQNGGKDEFAKALGTLKDFNFSEKEIENKIIDELFKENPELKEKINSVFNARDEYERLVNKKLNFDIKDKTPKELEEFVKEYGETIKKVKESFQKANPEKYDSAVKTAENILSKAEFMNELRQTSVVQIPVVINNNAETAEIYIFNNKKNKNKKDGGAISALISLDTGYIGHFEAYVVKENRGVYCQFRVSETTKKIISENISLLGKYLKDYDLDLKSCSFKEINEKFSLEKKEPAFEENNNKILMKNFAFDALT